MNGCRLGFLEWGYVMEFIWTLPDDGFASAVRHETSNKLGIMFYDSTGSKVHVVVTPEQAKTLANRLQQELAIAEAIESAIATFDGGGQ